MDERRDGDIVARVGGEEFAWIMPDADGTAAEPCAERARRAIADTSFPGVGNLTTSIGVCALDDADGDQELFRQADLALYWAKSGGRNAVMRYRPENLKRPTDEARGAGTLFSPDAQAERARADQSDESSCEHVGPARRPGI